MLPKHWWEGSDAEGRKRASPRPRWNRRSVRSLPDQGIRRRPHPGAGAGQGLLGKDLPTNVGHDNFDLLRYEFFRDPTVGLEAFKGDQVDWFVEHSANAWKTRYDFPAVRDARVIKEKFPTASVGPMQGYVFNLRRPLFKDVRLRRAFNYAYDFEEMNRQLSFGDYQRDNSYFDGTELASSGLPEGQELQILETVRDKVPGELFTTPYKNPVNGNPENLRNNLREAARLLKEAGFEIKDRQLTGPDGKPVTVEFLTRDVGDQRGILFYKPNLERLGVTVTIRTVDDAQYQNRLRNFDFDIVTDLWAQSLSPGNEQREFFGSRAADQSGSRNTPGIKNPAVDALIDRIIFATTAPSWSPPPRRWTGCCCGISTWCRCSPSITSATRRWDRFSHPDPLPKYGISGFPDLWWWDADKAARIGKRS